MVNRNKRSDFVDAESFLEKCRQECESQSHHANTVVQQADDARISEDTRRAMPKGEDKARAGQQDIHFHVQSTKLLKIKALPVLCREITLSERPMPVVHCSFPGGDRHPLKICSSMRFQLCATDAFYLE